MRRLLSWLLKSEDDKPFELEFSQLSEWLGNYVDNSVSRDIASYGMLLKALEMKAKDLESVSINEIKAEKKLKELVSGNKPAYVNALKILSQKIEPPKSYSLKIIGKFCSDTETAFDDFNMRTARNYAILKTIIGKEMEDIIVVLKQLEALAIKIKEDYVKSSRLKTAEELREKLAFFYEFEAAKSAMGEKRLALQRKKDNVASQLENINNELQNLRDGRIFKDYESLNIQISELASEELRIKGTLSAMFSELARPLRKLDAKSRLITRYLEDAHDALSKDEGMEISGLLNELQDKIETNKIEVKNKKKMIDSIILYRAELKKLKERINTINFQRHILSNKLSENYFEKKEKELVGNFSKLENEFSELMLELQQLDEKGKEYNIKAIARDIEKLAGRKVEIKNAPIM